MRESPLANFSELELTTARPVPWLYGAIQLITCRPVAPWRVPEPDAAELEERLELLELELEEDELLDEEEELEEDEEELLELDEPGPTETPCPEL